MLKSLEIENIAVIEKVSIEFNDGFNVLTGETGAGKSIIIDSINAVLGLRTSKDLVRTGASHALVIAVFSPISDEVKRYLDSVDIDLGTDDLILQRRINADGKSSCRINGKPVSAGTMKELSELLVNIHGQHDSQKLLDSDRHYLYLDRLIGDSVLLEDYRDSYTQLVSILKELKSLQTDEAEKEKTVQQLEFEINQIEKANIKPGEKKMLMEQRDRLRSVATITQALQNIRFFLNGDDDTNGALGLTGAAISEVESLGNGNESPLRSSLIGAQEQLFSALDSTGRMLEEINASPFTLDEIEQRLGVYYDFSTRYGKNEEEILEYLDNAKRRLAKIAFEDERRKELETLLSVKKEETYRKAVALSELRQKTARDFEKRMQEELSFLNMPSAKFIVNFDAGPISKNGIDEIFFSISVNAGEDPKPLASVASGGELSRIMLAFRSVLGEKESVPTLIFDEIDTGVSGRAAGKVGMKLQDVSRSCQVICVTHLAQIAASAQHHYLIYKQVVDGRTYTNVKPLDSDGRLYEIARITGGLNINELMLENARQMIKEFHNDNL